MPRVPFTSRNGLRKPYVDHVIVVKKKRDDEITHKKLTKNNSQEKFYKIKYNNKSMMFDSLINNKLYLLEY